MSQISSKVRTILCGLVLLVWAASLRAQGPDAEQSEVASGTQQSDLAAGNFFQRLRSFYSHDWHGTIPAAAQTVSRRALDASIRRHIPAVIGVMADQAPLGSPMAIPTR